MRSPRCHATVKAKRSQVNGMTRNKLGGGASISPRNRMSGDGALRRHRKEGFVWLWGVWMFAYCELGHGGQARRTAGVGVLLEDVVRPHVRVVKSITVTC